MTGKEKSENLFIHSLKNMWPALKFYKKQIITVIVIICFLSLGIVVNAAGRTPKEKPDNWKEDPGFFNKMTFGMVEDIFTGDDTAQVAEQVKISYSESGSNIKIGGQNIENLGEIIKSVNDMCKGLAMLFLIITFFLGLLAVREREQMDAELLRRLIMFILGLVCVYYAMEWCFTIANVGSEMASKIASSGAGIQNATNVSVVDQLQSRIWDETHIANYDHGHDGFTGGFDWFETYMENLGMCVSYTSELFIPWLMMKIARIIVSVVIWGRALEVMIVSAFSPLGFAETPDPNNPVSGTGLRFIKNMMALSISGAIIVFVMFATNQIILNMFSNIVVGNDTTFSEIKGTIFSMVIVSFARVAMITRAQTIAKGVVGSV